MDLGGLVSWANAATQEEFEKFSIEISNRLQANLIETVTVFLDGYDRHHVYVRFANEHQELEAPVGLSAAYIVHQFGLDIDESDFRLFKNTPLVTPFVSEELLLLREQRRRYKRRKNQEAFWAQVKQNLDPKKLKKVVLSGACSESDPGWYDSVDFYLEGQDEPIKLHFSNRDVAQCCLQYLSLEDLLAVFHPVAPVYKRCIARRKSFKRLKHIEIC